MVMIIIVIVLPESLFEEEEKDGNLGRKRPMKCWTKVAGSSSGHCPLLSSPKSPSTKEINKLLYIYVVKYRKK
jgi:hypothetical protein